MPESSRALSMTVGLALLAALAALMAGLPVFWPLVALSVAFGVWLCSEVVRVDWLSRRGAWSKTAACTVVFVVLGVAMYRPLVAQHEKERLARVGAMGNVPDSPASATIPTFELLVPTPSSEVSPLGQSPLPSPRTSPAAIPRMGASPSPQAPSMTFSGPVSGSIITQGQTGGQNVVNNLGVPARRMNVDQETVFLRMLAERQKGSVSIQCQLLGGREPCDFARQLTALLKKASWEPTLGEAMAMGPPEAEIPELYLMVREPNSPAASRGLGLMEALHAVGYQPKGLTRDSLAPDELVLWVHTQKSR